MVVEKVEDEDALIEVMEFGIDCAQGYLLGEPRLARPPPWLTPGQPAPGRGGCSLPVHFPNNCFVRHNRACGISFPLPGVGRAGNFLPMAPLHEGPPAWPGTPLPHSN